MSDVPELYLLFSFPIFSYGISHAIGMEGYRYCRISDKLNHSIFENSWISHLGTENFIRFFSARQLIGRYYGLANPHLASWTPLLYTHKQKKGNWLIFNRTPLS